jgi:hypothetical protein
MTTMNKILFGLCFSITFFILKGCVVSGNTVTTKDNNSFKKDIREVSYFNSIDISGVYEVNISLQKPQLLEITGNINILPLVKTEVRNGTLFIFNEKNIDNNTKIQVYISAKDIKRVASGGSNTIVLSEVNNDVLNLNFSGASANQLSGKTKKLNIKMSGSGNLDAKNLYAEKVKIDLYGTGMADVYPTQELNAAIYGTGTVYYSSKPQIVTKNIYGPGVIKKK